MFKCSCGLTSAGDSCVACEPRGQPDIGCGGLLLLLAFLAVLGGGLLYYAFPRVRSGVKNWLLARSCKTTLEEQLERKPSLDATVQKCSTTEDGTVLCFVKLLEHGEYKTRSIEWNCPDDEIPFR